MNRTTSHLHSSAGASFTKAVTVTCVQMRPASCQRWHKHQQSGSGSQI